MMIHAVDDDGVFLGLLGHARLMPVLHIWSRYPVEVHAVVSTRRLMSSTTCAFIDLA